MWILPQVRLCKQWALAIGGDLSHASILQVSGVAPSPRGGIACASIGTKVIVFGGSDREPSTFDDLWVLETGEQTTVTHHESPHSYLHLPCMILVDACGPAMHCCMHELSTIPPRLTAAMHAPLQRASSMNGPG